MTENYYTGQIDRLEQNPEHSHSMAISDSTGTMTNWMNITPAQLNAIRNILADPAPPEAPKAVKALTPDERYFKTLDKITEAQTRITNHYHRAKPGIESRHILTAISKIEKAKQLMVQARKARK